MYHLAVVAGRLWHHRRHSINPFSGGLYLSSQQLEKGRFSLPCPLTFLEEHHIKMVYSSSFCTSEVQEGRARLPRHPWAHRSSRPAHTYGPHTCHKHEREKGQGRGRGESEEGGWRLIIELFSFRPLPQRRISSTRTICDSECVHFLKGFDFTSVQFRCPLWKTSANPTSCNNVCLYL